MTKINQSKKRMFYRLLNHLKNRIKLQKEVPAEYVAIISKIESKKIPNEGDLLTETKFKKRTIEQSVFPIR